MSDPPASSTKPKVGSLRDRIAAFEKPSAGNSAPGPTPAPRPKPGGLSWKPKVPSPPSSPGTEPVAPGAKAGGMSASDAKESITKGGSLKERMAALQGKGAFGASPPVTPKTTVEKPKWKPPPVVAPADKGEDEQPTEPSISPPVPSHPERVFEDEPAIDTHEEETVPAADDEKQTEIDPQEEERQRRAAIAARMARLGGARVGMAPMFGRPPVAKKPEFVKPPSSEGEQAKAVEGNTPAEVEDDAAPVTSPTEIVSEARAVGTSAVNASTRKSSESLSQPSGDNDSQASRSPNSMPLPAAPRRAAPPRKKAVKSPTPPTAISDGFMTETQDILSATSTPAISKKADAGIVEHELGEVSREAIEHPEVASEEPAQEYDHVEIRNAENKKSADIVPQFHAPEVRKDVEDGDSVVAQGPSAEVPAKHEHAPVYLDEDKPIGQPADELDEDEEATRRKRVAGKLAKMGGINPLAPSPAVQRKSSTDETQTPSPPLVRSASLSRQSIDSVSPLPRRQSLRKSSVDSTTVFEEGKPSSDEPQSYVSPRLVKRASLSSRSSDPPPSPQRKQSFRKSSMDSTLEEHPTQSSQELPSQHRKVSPPSRKSSVDRPVAGSVSDSVSRGESQDVADHVGQGVATTRIREESEPSSGVEEVLEKHEAHIEVPKSRTKGELESKTHQKLESLGVVDSDGESGSPVIPAPPAPKWTTRPHAAPAGPAPAVDPLPVPLRAPEQIPLVAVPPPTRSIPHPPPVLMPQPDDEDESGSEYDDVEETHVSHKTLLQQISEDEGSAPPRQMPPRLVSNDDNTDNESDPLPVPSRRPPQPQGVSLTSSRPVRRSMPPPPPPMSAPASDAEQDSDLDEILPTPPRHRPTTPGAPPSNEVPLIVPPPHAEDHLRKVVEPSPLRHSYPSPMHVSSDSRSPTPEGRFSPHLTPALSASDHEILDEEEGDPIDPAFHSPSRRDSLVNLAATAATQATEQAIVEPEQQVDAEQVKRTTIAERMAKLGGIKFGAAPIPPSISRPPPIPRPEDESGGAQSSDVPAPEEQADIDEEEEERARKKRIAAKLAGMGGMRIGMMPSGPGGLRPQQSHALREDDTATPLPAPAHPPPSRAVPPSRPPPPPQSDGDLEHEGMSVSHGSSEEGVKVEAEESEMEEVSHEDAKEEMAPRVPTRPVRRGTSETESTKTSTTPTPRPPVPTSMPTRRSSIQASGRKASTDSNLSLRRSATLKAQSDYVMVEEPKAFVPDEVPPPPPPARPLMRAPSARETRPSRPPAADPADISSHWELPSIPSSSLEFGGNADLSLSWSDAGAPELPVTGPSPPFAHERQSARASRIVSPDQPRSSDDLIAIWGRIGVQICEVATSLFEKSKKSLVGDGTYHGFINAVVSEVPNAVLPAPPSYGHVVYTQSGSSVQKRVSEIMPGDIVELQDAKFKGHKGLQTYSQHVGVGERLVGVVSEFEPKKSKVRLFQANQHVGQQTVEAVSYRLEDLKSGTVKAYRVLEA